LQPVQGVFRGSPGMVWLMPIDAFDRDWVADRTVCPNGRFENSFNEYCRPKTNGLRRRNEEECRSDPYPHPGLADCDPNSPHYNETLEQARIRRQRELGNWLAAHPQGR